MKSRILSATILAAALGFALSAGAQLNWASYDTSGNVIDLNAGSGSTVSFAVPAGTTRIFLTKNFAVLDLTAANTTKTVNFTFEASGGLTGIAGGTRVLGWGLFNSAGTSSWTDDGGFWTRFNYGNYPEMLTHVPGGANLFSGSQQGQGGAYSGSPVDQTTYNALIRLMSNATGTGIRMGNNTPLANAGAAIQGPGVDQRAYINPVTPPPGGFFTFDEFAFYFNNTTGDEITLTLGAVDLTPAVVPEPSSFALAGLGLLGLLIRRNRN